METWDLAAAEVAPHLPVVLRSDEGANRVVLIALPAGEALGDHQVHEHALAFVVEGELVVRAGEEEQVVRAPGLAHFDPAERHEVRATRDTRLVLCLAPWPGHGHPSRER